jgi:hypothetical protein
MILVPPNGRGKARALAAAPSALAAPAAVPEAPPIAEVPAPFAAPEAPPEPDAPVAPVESVAAATTFEPDVEPEPVQTFPAAPPAFLDQPIDAPFDPVHGHNVDVFEELARLPEPVPLGDPSAPVPDLLAPPDPFDDPLVGVPTLGPPEGTVELVDSEMPEIAAAGPAAWNAADAPPIDVALRQGSATWDLGEPPLVGRADPAPEPATWETEGWQPPAPDGTAAAPNGFWESTDEWTSPQSVAPGGIDEAIDVPEGEPMTLGEDTWAGAAWDPEAWSPVESAASDPTTSTSDPATVDVNPWSTGEWPSEPAGLGAWDHRPDPAAVDTGFYVDWGTPETETDPGLAMFAEPWAPAAETGTVDGAEAAEAWPPVEPVEPAETWEPLATVETGEVDDAVDEAAIAGEQDEIGEEIGEGAVDVFATFDTTALDPTTTPAADASPTWDLWTQPADEQDATDDATGLPLTGAPPMWDEWTPPTETPVAVDDADDDFSPTETLEPVSFEPVLEPESEGTELAPICWRADGTDEPETDAAPPAIDAVASAGWEPIAGREPEPERRAAGEEFVTAGPDWQLGNALPLVEVRGQGGLVMRRADERWALADVTSTPDFVAEVEVDFRSGPGLGVLFRASIDDDGRMSGYSFDIDPIYDGGGYLVRQWQADRELWNPIARVNGDDPAAMYGTLLVRIEVLGEHLSAQVNGVEVLTVENLKQASADRGRDAATGDRVGVQAWSSSDLVIDAVRVAAR